MDQAKFKTAVDALTAAAASDANASDALQLLIADYVATKAQVEELDRNFRLVTGGPSVVARVLDEARKQRTDAVAELAAAGGAHGGIIGQLHQAQASLVIATQKVDEYVAEYEALEKGTDVFVDHVRRGAGAALKTFLGPAAELGPVKNIADRLFA